MGEPWCLRVPRLHVGHERARSRLCAGAPCSGLAGRQADGGGGSRAAGEEEAAPFWKIAGVIARRLTWLVSGICFCMVGQTDEEILLQRKDGTVTVHWVKLVLRRDGARRCRPPSRRRGRRRRTAAVPGCTWMP